MFHEFCRTRLCVMEDVSRIPTTQCSKVFIHRDYTDGTAVRFVSKFPQELEGKVIVLKLSQSDLGSFLGSIRVSVYVFL